VHHSEFTAADLFRSVHLPRLVDPGKAKAEYRNGLLTVTVPAAPVKNVNVNVA
jgi:HSP20 family molecular chaperone IbpA